MWGAPAFAAGSSTPATHTPLAPPRPPTMPRPPLLPPPPPSMASAVPQFASPPLAPPAPYGMYALPPQPHVWMPMPLPHAYGPAGWHPSYYGQFARPVLQRQPQHVPQSAPRPAHASTTGRADGGKAGTPAVGDVTLWIGKLEDTDDRAVRALVTAPGDLLRWKRATDPDTGGVKPFGFATYGTLAAASRALRLLNGLVLPSVPGSTATRAAIIVKADGPIMERMEAYHAQHGLNVGDKGTPASASQSISASGDASSSSDPTGIASAATTAPPEALQAGMHDVAHASDPKSDHIVNAAETAAVIEADAAARARLAQAMETLIVPESGATHQAAAQRGTSASTTLLDAAVAPSQPTTASQVFAHADAALGRAAVGANISVPAHAAAEPGNLAVSVPAGFATLASAGITVAPTAVSSELARFKSGQARRDAERIAEETARREQRAADLLRDGARTRTDAASATEAAVLGSTAHGLGHKRPRSPESSRNYASLVQHEQRNDDDAAMYRRVRHREYLLASRHTQSTDAAAHPRERDARFMDDDDDDTGASGAKGNTDDDRVRPASASVGVAAQGPRTDNERAVHDYEAAREVSSAAQPPVVDWPAVLANEQALVLLRAWITSELVALLGPAGEDEGLLDFLIAQLAVPLPTVGPGNSGADIGVVDAYADIERVNADHAIAQRAAEHRRALATELHEILDDDAARLVDRLWSEGARLQNLQSAAS